MYTVCKVYALLRSFMLCMVRYRFWGSHDLAPGPIPIVRNGNYISTKTQFVASCC